MLPQTIYAGRQAAMAFNEFPFGPGPGLVVCSCCRS